QEFPALAALAGVPGAQRPVTLPEREGVAVELTMDVALQLRDRVAEDPPGGRVDHAGHHGSYPPSGEPVRKCERIVIGAPKIPPPCSSAAASAASASSEATCSFRPSRRLDQLIDPSPGELIDEGRSAITFITRRRLSAAAR